MGSPCMGRNSSAAVSGASERGPCLPAFPAPGRRLSAASAASSHQRGTPLLGASFRATMTINAIGGSSLGGFAGGSVGGFGGIGGTGHGSGAVASFLAGERRTRDGGGSSERGA